MSEKSKHLLVCTPQSALFVLSISHEVEPCHGAMLPCTAAFTSFHPHPFVQHFMSAHCHVYCFVPVSISRPGHRKVCLKQCNRNLNPTCVKQAQFCLFVCFSQYINCSHDNVFKMIACACQNCTLKKKKKLTPLPVYNTVINTIHFSNTQRTQHKNTQLPLHETVDCSELDLGSRMRCLAVKAQQIWIWDDGNKLVLFFFTSQERAC